MDTGTVESTNVVDEHSVAVKNTCTPWDQPEFDEEQGGKGLLSLSMYEGSGKEDKNHSLIESVLLYV